VSRPLGTTREPAVRCGACGAAIADDSTFCPRCGAELEGDELVLAEARGRVLPGLLALIAIVALAGTAYAVRQARDARREAQTRLHTIQRLEERVSALDARADAVTKAGQQVRHTAVGAAATARRARDLAAFTAKKVAPSIFTVSSSRARGTAWVAWRQDGSTYLLASVRSVGADRGVTVSQPGRSLRGSVVAKDPTNDLATIRVPLQVGTPLWPDPSIDTTPAVGGPLTVVASTYRAPGTVAATAVGRVDYGAIPLALAPLPDDAGAPALDAHGRVVGVVRTPTLHDAQMIVVPVRRACVALRRCG
jgi:hypothetical protein